MAALAMRTAITPIATKRSMTTMETVEEREDRMEVLEEEGQAMAQVVQEEEVVVPKGQKMEAQN